MAEHHATEAEFYQLLGEVVVRWNACEAHLRDLIIWLSGGRSAITLALTAHMTAKALTDALPALTGSKSTEIREHLEHYAKAVDRLREYRNYYAHGIGQIGPSMLTGGEVAAWVSQVTGKLRVKVTYEHLSPTPLATLLADLKVYQEYGRRIQRACNPNFGGSVFGSLPLLGAWPNKPPLPDRLTKPIPILIGAPPPPES